MPAHDSNQDSTVSQEVRPVAFISIQITLIIRQELAICAKHDEMCRFYRDAQAVESVLLSAGPAVTGDMNY